ncbi:polysaccharide biosynthesis protein [Pseudonocardia sp. TRM90224]|uniref:polysaccharide biosynthesis protein n=1 Tax=Pseudonocardia sp. TRM90224 TaxID=2812678 RepID=UPI001E604B4B|nr:nucleoside-diphosphate sugar epimerase/dehydratase [Pseudonocardia sp. TRM90224]
MIAVPAQWAGGVLSGAYRGRHYPGSAEEAVTLALVAAGVAVVLTAVAVAAPLQLPRSVPFAAALVMIPLAVGARVLWVMAKEVRGRRARTPMRPVIVFGAGDAGRQLIRAMHADPRGSYRPVAVLDDDPALRHRKVAGIAVGGGRADIAEVAARTGAGRLVIAMPSADPSTVAEIAEAAAQAGLGVQVLPPLKELFKDWVGLSDLRDLDVTALLGRRPVDTDVSAIAGFLRGRKVLVTGAGGSIGSELCRQIDRFGPAELMMLDRDESALHAVQLSIKGRALLDTSDVVLADIRDIGALHDIFQLRQPDVVFHAAALKHLPMLEQYPEEAWKTNVLGTQNVLEAALGAGVDRFVNISTDKAADPISVLGRSKRVGERLVASVATSTGLPYMSVRFGNVLGSRGSVITTFAEQISSGKPLTITHPDVTRFFMTIPEAVELVVQAGGIGRPGEVLVLDMGAPVRIVDLAEQLMALAGQTCPIVYTGLRVGEKLHEDLFGAGEQDLRPLHPAISHVDVPALDLDEIAGLPMVGDPSGSMIELTGGRQPHRPRLASAGGGSGRAGSGGAAAHAEAAP